MKRVLNNDERQLALNVLGGDFVEWKCGASASTKKKTTSCRLINTGTKPTQRCRHGRRDWHFHNYYEPMIICADALRAALSAHEKDSK